MFCPTASASSYALGSSIASASSGHKTGRLVEPRARRYEPTSTHLVTNAHSSGSSRLTPKSMLVSPGCAVRSCTAGAAAASNAPRPASGTLKRETTITDELYETSPSPAGSRAPVGRRLAQLATVIDNHSHEGSPRAVRRSVHTPAGHRLLDVGHGRGHRQAQRRRGLLPLAVRRRAGRRGPGERHE